MSVAVDYLDFYSQNAIDKTVTAGTLTIVNSGATPQYQQANIVTASIANPYAAPAYIRYTWSIDGLNFNSPTSDIPYTFTLLGSPSGNVILYGLQAAVSAGVSAANITFVTANGYHGDVTYSTGAYSPISLTFTIRYAVFALL